MSFREFIDRHTAEVETLAREANIAHWDASRSGSGDDFKRFSRLNLELEKVYTRKDEFELVRDARDSGGFDGPEEKRMADLLYLRYLGKQVDDKLLQSIIDLSTEIEKRFSVFRAEVGGRKLTSNDVCRTLRESTDTGYRKMVWEASKKVGCLVSGEMVELATLRNEAARRIGYDDYYSMSMALSELDEAALVDLFTGLEEVTREPFLEAKGEIDVQLAGNCGIAKEDLRPWHYHDPYFQEIPDTGSADLSGYYRGKDTALVAAWFYAGIGMPVEEILARSDLYEREGKNPHAFCTDIDRRGDIRILCNLTEDGHSMETILHELGHGVYDKYIDPGLPYILRVYPHLCTTEASAMFFGRFAHDPGWMQKVLGIDPGEAAGIAPYMKKRMRFKQLLFARWSLVMFHFERGLYRDPVRDLNKLWWDIVEKYQFLTRPEGRDQPDWATKTHIISAPVYYHNYMLGEMIASQLHEKIRMEIPGIFDEGGSAVGRRELGDFLRCEMFAPGNILPWNEHVERVTGEQLSVRHFVEQFVKEQD